MIEVSAGPLERLNIRLREQAEKMRVLEADLDIHRKRIAHAQGALGLSNVAARRHLSRPEATAAIASWLVDDLDIGLQKTKAGWRRISRQV
jgi:hypothetical protein